MFHSIDEFLAAWQQESASTLKVLNALTDASLEQAVAPGHRKLGRIAWHIATSITEMLTTAGLPIAGPSDKEPPPATAAAIVAAYKAASGALAAAIPTQWTDAMLAGKIPMYGEPWSRAQTLQVLISHEIHHRGQMTVLMRQAGLAVPGVCGPAQHEWALYGMPTLE